MGEYPGEIREGFKKPARDRKGHEKTCAKGITERRLALSAYWIEQFGIRVKQWSLDSLPQAHGGEAVQVHLGRLHLCHGEAVVLGIAHCETARYQ